MGSCDNTIALKPGTVEKSHRREIGDELPGMANQVARRRCAGGRSRCEPVMDDCRGVRRRPKINLAAYGNPQG
ncbi:MAG: hypothetical protein DLM68_03195 [Hyphomicrobiales bacterium]|nr:MAG: hypothetical protein DLM68_03195 [Hyphomicrobiales bacterium]